MSRFADAHKIKNYTIDGNDVVKVFETVKKEIKGLRNGSGPIFLECITFRHFGHVGPEENIDVGVKRTQKDVLNWKRTDPILRLSKSLNKKNIFSTKENHIMSTNIINDIEKIYKLSKKNIITKQKKIKHFSY